MAAKPDIKPFYLDGARGPLFAVYYPPLGAPSPLGDVLVAPAFAEEMNRCRAMVALQARELARVGIGTLVLDMFGTGDSAGEFAEGSWSAWREDLCRGVEWLRHAGNGCRTMWGIRLGALLASEIALGDAAIERLLLWQPVLDGKTFLTQFLRIRIAAELEQNGGIKSTDELRRMCAAGESIEVSGYRIAPRLMEEIDAARWPDPARLRGKHLTWFEVLAAADSIVPRPSTKALEACKAAGVRVDFETVVGPAFWQVHEREVAPSLIAAGTARLGGGVEPPAPHPHASVSAGTRTAAVWQEQPVVFPCRDDQLLGVLHRGNGARRGVVIVIAGGPQYRAGAHRQFVSLARRLESLGHPVLRFDLRGMGDSSGEHLGFEHSIPDVRAAIDALQSSSPNVDEVVLFGECESASAILFYAYQDPRVAGAVLVNPWVRTEGGRAGVIMKHYYLQRLASLDFWRKVVRGGFDLRSSVSSFVTTLRIYLRSRASPARDGGDRHEDLAGLPLPERTAAGMRRFRGRVLIVMSGHDYIAREFDEVIRASVAWQGLLEDPRVTRHDLAGADHTFSRDVWKRQASDWVCEWVASW